MTFQDRESLLTASSKFFSNETQNNSSANTLHPTLGVLIAFHLGQVISLSSVVLGILGNTLLIIILYRSSLWHFAYSLIILFISIFDILRLLSIVFYYLLHANLVPVNLFTATVYVVWSRYPKVVTNWLKVVLAVERLLAVKYWLAHRYNVHSNDAKRVNRLRRRKLLVFISCFLLASLISQHPNFVFKRFLSARISATRLLIVSVPNPNFYYGHQPFNGELFTIISYILLDDLLPIFSMMICNSVLIYELRHLPPRTSGKLVESIYVLFLLTIFSLFVAPRSFIIVFNLYVNPRYINDTVISVAFHSFQGETSRRTIFHYSSMLIVQVWKWSITPSQVTPAFSLVASYDKISCKCFGSCRRNFDAATPLQARWQSNWSPSRLCDCDVAFSSSSKK